jgi:hypothetical protein
VADLDLEQLVRPEFKDQYREIAAFLFCDETSSQHQAGYLKASVRCGGGGGTHLFFLFCYCCCYLHRWKVSGTAF